MVTENQGSLKPGNIAGTASRVCGPVDTYRWYEAGNFVRQVGVVHNP